MHTQTAAHGGLAADTPAGAIVPGPAEETHPR